MTTTTKDLTGVWDIVLTRPGATYPGVFTFTEEGVASTADGASGRWWRDDETFSWRMADTLKDPQGTAVGKLEMNQTATIDGDSFSSKGIHYVFSLEGEQVAEVEVTITGTRR